MKTGPPNVHRSTPTFFRKYRNKDKWHNPYRSADGFFELYLTLTKKAEENNITNIKTIVTEENDLKVDDGAVTYACICTVLHEVENMYKFLNELLI
jgi:hypothetical protein